jgi:hypothetical protein
MLDKRSNGTNRSASAARLFISASVHRGNSSEA